MFLYSIIQIRNIIKRGRYSLQKKNILIAILFTIIILLVPFTSVSGISIVGLNTKDDNPEVPYLVSDSTTLILHTYDKTDVKQKSVFIPKNDANQIYNLFEELIHMIRYQPISEETKVLKIKFVDMLDMNDLIPKGLSKDYVLSLLNPSWNYNQGTSRVKHILPVLKGFITRILRVFVNIQEFFKIRFGNTYLSGLDENFHSSKSSKMTASALIPFMTGGGTGSSVPFIMLPRLRFIALWNADADGYMYADTVIGRDFTSEGEQSGIVFSFIGLGLTLPDPDFYMFIFVGYALLASVVADYIKFGSYEWGIL
jgi:hypothetical protein